MESNSNIVAETSMAGLPICRQQSSTLDTYRVANCGDRVCTRLSAFYDNYAYTVFCHWKADSVSDSPGQL